MKKLLLLMAVFLCVTLLFGCKAKERIVEVPITHTEYVYKDSVKYDSIFCHDSIYIEKNDSIIYVNKIQYRYKYKYITNTDSILVNDTIVKPVEKIVKVEVERNLTSKEKFYMKLGKTISIALLIFIVALIIVIYLKHRK